MKPLQTLSDSELLLQTRSLVSRERPYDRVTCALRGSSAASLRRTRLSSLFDYVRRGLGYCEGSADRRISAMRLLKELRKLAIRAES